MRCATSSTQSNRSRYRGIVTFLTDFGLVDGYAGVIKGVVLQQAPHAVLVDITHELSPFDLRAASLVLDSAFDYFPQGTIHVVVIDPGVGSLRRHLLVKACEHTFIGPDNGILGRIAKLHKGETFQINPDSLGVIGVSNTFHGRDIYAFAAGKLLKGTDPASFSSPIDNPAVLDLPEPQRLSDGWEGEVLYIDRFGNLITNLRADCISGESSVWFDENRLPLVQSYMELVDGNPGVILNSWGYYEIALRNASAGRFFNAQLGMKITVKP